MDVLDLVDPVEGRERERCPGAREVGAQAVDLQPRAQRRDPDELAVGQAHTRQRGARGGEARGAAGAPRAAASRAASAASAPAWAATNVAGSASKRRRRRTTSVRAAAS